MMQLYYPHHDLPPKTLLVGLFGLIQHTDYEHEISLRVMGLR